MSSELIDYFYYLLETGGMSRKRVDTYVYIQLYRAINWVLSNIQPLNSAKLFSHPPFHASIINSSHIYTKVSEVAFTKDDLQFNTLINHIQFSLVTSM